MTSSNFMDIFGGNWAVVARVACWRGPWGANVFLLDVSSALIGANASLEGYFTSFTSQLRFLFDNLM
jgi:hypothetical protein